MTSKLEIAISTPDEAAYVDSLIVEFNQSQIPFSQDPTPIVANYVIKDNGNVVAGINAIIYHRKMCMLMNNTDAGDLGVNCCRK
jgi:hypothetical protein